ncbi:MAG: nucleotidyltransferase family protein [Verrucomicrobia bacterium]|nr:nucleotidyltransferase family protein [Verrucomicrobiota bacterium]
MAAEAIAHLILAAGASRRLGRPKQLVEWRGEPLLRRAARVALEQSSGPVLVVLGAVVEECRRALAGLAVETSVAETWAEGMGASLSAGVRRLQSGPELAGLGVLLCDQFRVEADHLTALRTALTTGRSSMAAARDGAWLGPPAYFRPRWFPELARLEGERGARSLIARHPQEAAVIDLPGIADDLDEPGDLERLIHREETSAAKFGVHPGRNPGKGTA